ncbi:MAG: DUF481 domain-containing protein, partial [Verrucomicrobiota bacterium]
ALAQDSIVFKNGDVLTGTILKQDAEHVQFETGSFGAVNLKTSDIAEIRPGTLEPGEVAVPAEAVAPEPAPEAAVSLSQLYSDLFSKEPVPQAAATPELAPAPQATPPTPAPPVAPPKAPNKWTGQAGLAIAMREKTYSNSSGVYNEEDFETYRLYGHINWKGEKNNLNWNWNYRYSEDETRKRDDYLNITQKFNHHFKGGYYAEAKTVYQRDYNRRIDSEYLQTAEIGKKWLQKPRFKFSTSIGGAYHQYERSLTGETVRTSEPKLIFDESIEWTLVNSLKLFQKYTHLGGMEKYHLVFTSGLENKLVRDVFLRLEYRLDRDTETTYDDRGYYDKALLTSLLYKF